MSGFLARLLRGVAESTNPFKSFERLLVKYDSDFRLNENDLIELWRTCSEFILEDTKGTFGSLVTLIIVEKILRQVPVRDRAIWRRVFFESSQKRRIAILEQLLSKKQEGDKIVKQMYDSIFPILDAINKFKSMNINKEAADLLEMRYSIIGAALQKLDDDALLALQVVD